MFSFNDLFNQINTEYKKIYNKDIPSVTALDNCGSTGYIDFINSSYFEDDNNIITGKDIAGRRFISFCMDITFYKEEEEEFENKDEKEEEIFKKKKQKKVVGTVFERYQNNSNSLAYGTCYRGNILFYDSRIRDTHDFELVKNRILLLLKGETIFDFDTYSLIDGKEPFGNGNCKLHFNSIRKKIQNNIENFIVRDEAGCVIEYL